MLDNLFADNARYQVVWPTLFYKHSYVIFYFCTRMIYETCEKESYKYGCKVVNNDTQINNFILFLGDMSCLCYIVTYWTVAINQTINKHAIIKMIYIALLHPKCVQENHCKSSLINRSFSWTLKYSMKDCF